MTSTPRGTIELAVREPDLPRARDRLADAQAAERRLRERLEQPIRWVKPGGLVPSGVPLADAVTTLRDLIADRLAGGGVALATDFDPAAPPAFGPPDAFKMAALDPVVNAVTALDTVSGRAK